MVSIWRGNVQLEQVCFREEDVFKTADRITQVFLRYKISKDHDYLFADDGGIGKAIIQVIRKDGWNIKRILNQSAPKAGKNDYKNRGMELWYRFSRFVELGYIKPLEDEKMWSQIGSRHYKRSTDAPVVKLQLESKQAEIAEGHNSPDRADAAVLAFTDVTIESLTKLWDGIEVTPDPVKKGLSPEEVNQKYEEMVLGEHAEEIRGGKSRFVVGSLSAMIKQQSRARYAFTGNFTPRN